MSIRQHLRRMLWTHFDLLVLAS
jgi:hypothetical protein